MSIAKAIHRVVRVVPVRFARAPDSTDPTVSTGVFDGNAPEPDNRGFVPGGCAILPIGVREADALASRPEARVRLLRVDMEDAGALFVTSANPAIVQITDPPPPAGLANTREMMIKMRAVASGTTRLEVRFGTIGGPIIHALEVRVNPLIELRVSVHVPTINGPASVPPFPAISTRSDAAIQTLMDEVNEIFFPYGIRFTTDSIERLGVLALTNQGVADITTEFNTMMALNRVAGTVNVYFVPGIGDAPGTAPGGITGVGQSAKRVPAGFGLLVADSGLPQTAAHELGHLLNIVSFATGRFGHAHEDGNGRVVRDDIITRRRLMHPALRPGPDPARPYRDDVGYADIAGGLITIKQLDNDPTDLEHAEILRTAALI